MQDDLVLIKKKLFNLKYMCCECQYVIEILYNYEKKNSAFDL